MEERVHMTRDKAEIERLMREGHRPIAVRNGDEYVFKLPALRSTQGGEADRTTVQTSAKTDSPISSGSKKKAR